MIYNIIGFQGGENITFDLLKKDHPQKRFQEFQIESFKKETKQSFLDLISNLNGNTLIYPNQDYQIDFLIEIMESQNLKFKGNKCQFENKTLYIPIPDISLTKILLNKADFYQTFSKQLPIPKSLILTQKCLHDNPKIKKFFKKYQVLKKDKKGTGKSGLEEITINQIATLDPDKSFLQRKINGTPFSIDLYYTNGKIFTSYREAIFTSGGLVALAKIITDHKPAINLSNQIIKALKLKDKNGFYLFTADGIKNKKKLVITEIGPRTGGATPQTYNSQETPYTPLHAFIDFHEKRQIKTPKQKSGITTVGMHAFQEDFIYNQKTSIFVPVTNKQLKRFNPKKQKPIVGKKALISGEEKLILDKIKDPYAEYIIATPSLEPPNDNPILHQIYKVGKFDLITSKDQSEIYMVGFGVINKPDYEFFCFKKEEYELEEDFGFRNFKIKNDFQEKTLDQITNKKIYYNQTPGVLLKSENDYYLFTTTKALDSKKIQDLDLNDQKEIIFSHIPKKEQGGRFTISDEKGNILHQIITFKCIITPNYSESKYLSKNPKLEKAFKDYQSNNKT